MNGAVDCPFGFLFLQLLLGILLICPADSQAWISPSSASLACSSARFVPKSATFLSNHHANSRHVCPLLLTARGKGENDDDEEILVATTTRRRIFLTSHVPALLCMGASSTMIMLPETSHATAVQAVGSAESACREAGNCLEIGQWDGAVGWNWGGKDRCDAADPMCGPDGKIRVGEIIGQPVPRPPSGVDTADTSNAAAAAGGAATNIGESSSSSSAITHVAILRIDVGREESGIVRLGFYGRDAPDSVQQMVEFLSEDGLLTAASTNAADIGTVRVPVGLNRGGVVDLITPGVTIDFGVPSQSYAYARSRGTSKVPAGFAPQPRPSPAVVQNDAFVRSHNQAGLVSVSNKGLGYGGTGFETDDEAFESAFLITAFSSVNDNASSIAKTLDKNRRVIGQVLDNQSMAFLERLSTLPTKRGIRGVIPGQTSGPPLLKVVVREATVAKVVSR